MALEELVAELGAVLQSDRLEIGSHAVYLGHWVVLLKESPQGAVPGASRDAAAGGSDLSGAVRQGADESHLSMMRQQLSPVATLHHENSAVACEEWRDGNWAAKGRCYLS